MGVSMLCAAPRHITAENFRRERLGQLSSSLVRCPANYAPLAPL